MADNDTPGTPPNVDPAAVPPPAAGSGPPPAAGDGTKAAEGERTVHDVIAALQAEASDFKDKWLRAHAEIDNVRKRLEKEKEETAKYAITRLARDIVNVGDNFQRAISAIPPGAAEQDAALKSFLEGVTMTERELINVLERYGIKRVQPANEPFNPHMHQAVMEMDRPDLVAGTVVQVFQAGYTIEDRVLRPAMVAVARGGPKSAQPEPPAAEPQHPQPTAPGDGEASGPG